MNHVSNSTASLPGSFPSVAAQGQPAALRGTYLPAGPAWQSDRKPGLGPCSDDNAWRGIDSRRDRLSRADIVARIRTRVDPALLPEPMPVQPDAGLVPDSFDRLGRAVDRKSGA